MAKEILPANDTRPRRGILRSFRVKLIVSFAAILGLMLVATLLIQLFGIPFSSYDGIYHQVKKENERTLSLGADMAKDRLISLFDERKGDAMVLAEGASTRAAAERLCIFIGGGKKEGFDLAALKKLPEYAALEHRIHLIMAAYSTYESIKIADAATKKIMVSTLPNETGLAVPFDAFITEPISTGEQYIDLIKDSDMRYWIYISHPIRAGSSAKPIAVAILKIHVEEAINPVLKIAHELGEGAEVVFADKYMNIFAAMSAKDPIDKSIARNVATAPPTTPVAWAVKGQEGIKTAIDYRGVEVLAAYRHIPISKQETWGIAIKRQTADIFAATTTLVTYFVGLYLVLAALFLWIAAWIARNLAHPIETLAQLARRVAKGETDVRAPAFNGEPGILAENFNLALTTIEDNTRKLKDEIEERKRAEEELNRFFNLVPDMVCVATTDGRFLKVNPVWREILGYTEQELLSTPFLDFIHPDDSDTTLKEMAKLSSGETTMQFNSRYRCKDGSYKWLEWAAAPSIDRSMLFAAARDITERVNMLEELRHKTEMLERSNKELEQFAYVSSHDLQEPLRTITSYVQLLEKRYKSHLDEKAEMYMNFVTDAARRMQTLINDLLNFSRVGSRGKPFAPVRTDDLVDSIIALQKIQNPAATITRDKLPDIVADEMQIMQTFQNLVVNAVKYRGTEPPVIHIGAAEDDKEWTFWVKDNGIGIDPKYFERIFVIFQRLHTQREYSGTGIGLALVKKVVERHGGRVWVESEPGKGAKFWFTVSKEARSNEGPAEPAAPGPYNPGRVSPSGGKEPHKQEGIPA